MATAIKTKYYVDKNGNSKILASCERGRKSFFWSDFGNLEPKEKHIQACLELRKKFCDEDLKERNEPINKNFWLKKMVSGSLKDCYVHVFIE